MVHPDHLQVIAKVHPQPPMPYHQPAMDPFTLHLLMSQNQGGSSNQFQQMLLLQSLQGQQMGHGGYGNNPLLLHSLLNQCVEHEPCTKPNVVGGDLCGVDPDPLDADVYHMCCKCNN